ncbi:MAG TPA: tetratricopeptide repeat protein [Fontimonas sp.]
MTDPQQTLPVTALSCTHSRPTVRLALLALLAAVAQLSACAVTPAGAEAGGGSLVGGDNLGAPGTDAATVVEAAPAQALASDQAQAQYHVLAGEMAAGRQQPEVAAREFVAALRVLDDVELAERATALAVVARDEDLALEAARRWQQLSPNAAEPREILISLGLQTGDLSGTLEQCRELIRGNPGGIADGFRHVAQLMMPTSKDRADGALSIMGQLVEQWPAEAAAHHAYGAVALALDEPEKAEAAARKAHELAPKDQDHDLLLIGTWVRQGRIDEADARIDALVKGEKNADAAQLRSGYARLLLENNRRDAAREQFGKVLKLDSKGADAHYALAVMAYTDSDYDAATAHLQPLLKDPKRKTEAALLLGRIAEAQSRYPQALEYYSSVREGPPALDAALRSAMVLGRLGQTPQARQLLQSLRDRFPQLATRFYMAEGELLLNGDSNDEALALYDEALADNVDNSDLLYGRSLAYERLGKIDLAEKDLKTSIQNDPEDARALNALGYMLVVHSTRYSEAEDLIQRALALEPDDAAIIDSLGWLQFKQGRNEEALASLQKAYAQFPDPEVAAHLGEVLWALDDREQAQSVWREALDKHPGHDTLIETMKRHVP